MRDEVFYTLFEEFVDEAYPLLDPALEKKWIKPTYDKYPELKFEKNGMPRMSNYSFSSPPKIRDLFLKFGNATPDVPLEELESYNKLNSFLLSHKEYRECIYPVHVDSEQAEKFYNLLAPALIKDVLERYYLLNKKKTANYELLKSIYTEVENYIYADQLHFDISVPILFIRFTEEEFSFSDGVVLRKIPDEYQKARFNKRSYSPISDPIISSATHELVFRNYYIQKGNKYFDNSLSNESAYPLWRFELFFNALKIVTNHDSGFAQILLYPHGWANDFDMDLPSLQGISVKKYPNYFENFYWNTEELPLLGAEQVRDVFAIYHKLLNNENNKIQIANRRLRYSYLRDNDEDSILDIIIALETLLSDNEKGEITHKLALRTAKLLSVFNPLYKATEVFKAVKKIYGFRSAIVHGSSKVDSQKEIKLHEEAEPINTILLANNYLREVIRILTEHPHYLDAREIDNLLLS
jgi:hypothetical protein